MRLRRRQRASLMTAAAALVVGAATAVAGSGRGPLRDSGPVAGRTPASASSRPTTSSTSTEVPTPAPPYPVSGETLVLVDPTRPSPARGSVPGSDERVLRTMIRKPVGAAGPLPLVVFGPGFDTTPDTYLTLLDTWAAAGYLVAAPDFPGSASDLPGTPTEGDIAQQARDLSFVAASLIGGREGPVDTSRVAAAGHSDGGSSVVVLAEDPAYRDPLFRAYVVLAGQIPEGVAGPWDATTPGALLCMVGTDDQYGNLSLTTRAFDSAHMTKALVTVPGGDHEGIFTGSGTLADALRAATVRFLDGSLGTQAPSDALLASLVAPPAGGPWQVTAG